MSAAGTVNAQNNEAPAVEFATVEQVNILYSREKIHNNWLIALSVILAIVCICLIALIGYTATR